MASEKPDESHHRKHRRSSDNDEADKSFKRHKHRHSKHHHRHHHRHHRDKNVEEESQSLAGEMASPPSPVPVRCDDDVEEGEILEEVDFGEVSKKKSESDGESGEIKSGEFCDKNLPIEEDTHPLDERAGDKNHKETQPKDILPPKTDKENNVNGDVARESPRADKRRHRKSGSSPTGSGKKSYENSDRNELDGCLYSNTRSLFYSESSGEKYKSVTHSPSDGRYYSKVHARSRSRSHDLGRGRSRSRSVVDEEFAERRQRGSRDYDGRSREKYYNHGRYEEDDRHQTGEILDLERSRERDIDREEWKREKEREGRRFRETDSYRGREREREKRRETEEDHERRREKNRGYNRDRERMRELERNRIRDRDSERERNKYRDGAHSEWDRYSDKDNDRARHHSREREKQYDRSRNKGVETENNREKQSRHSKYDAEGDIERARTDSLKSHSSMVGNLGEIKENLRRDENEQQDNEETVWELPEQEEEELNRIKEESRKRKQAILEKYRMQQSQKHDELSVELKGKDSELAGNPDRSSDVVPNAVWKHEAPAAIVSKDVMVADVIQAEDATNHIASEKDAVKSESSLTVGKSPSCNGAPVIEKTSGPAGLGEGTPKSERSADMFCDDIFGESPAGVSKKDHLQSKGDGVPLVRSGLYDNWDDAEGYYSYQFGELLDGRYEVTATHGKGVFSTVVRAKDLKAGPDDPEEVAIKIIRNNETMHKAGQTEVQILKKLAGADPEKRRHCVLFLSSFKYRNHLCLVFESLHLNLREVLKKFGRNIGLKLTAVRAYAKQLFIALKHLKNCGVLHCDIKPDNMLVNEAKNVLKLCDFGNAMFAGKNEVTPYLVSRFYRAPEIILGLPYDHPLDVWSVGCCLYELYSGKVLFPGSTNNDMLRLHIELKGPFPKKMLRKGAFVDQHFDQDLNFHATEEDPVTGKTIRRMIVNSKPKDIGSIVKGYPGEDPKMLAHFKDLLDKIFTLDPERRLTVSQALAHPFITGK